MIAESVHAIRYYIVFLGQILFPRDINGRWPRVEDSVQIITPPWSDSAFKTI